MILCMMENHPKMNISTFRPITAWIPIAMSLSALAIVLFHIAVFGTARRSDEGTEAHLWQLLMAAQIPILLVYAVKWLPRTPKPALQVIAVQLGAATAALAPVYLLHW
jgi:glucan phosphoethanolaminetransferase (alkaline phosphatase superfamily)